MDSVIDKRSVLNTQPNKTLLLRTDCIVLNLSDFLSEKKLNKTENAPSQKTRGIFLLWQTIPLFIIQHQNLNEPPVIFSPVFLVHQQEVIEF